MIYLVEARGSGWAPGLAATWRKTGLRMCSLDAPLQAKSGDVVYFLDAHDGLYQVEALKARGTIVGGHLHGSSFDRMDPWFYQMRNRRMLTIGEVRELIDLERKRLVDFDFLTLNAEHQIAPIRNAGITTPLHVVGFPVQVPHDDGLPGTNGSVVLIQQRVMHDEQIGLAIELAYRLRDAGYTPVWLGQYDDEYAPLAEFVRHAHNIQVLWSPYPHHWATIRKSNSSITTSISDTLGVRVVETFMLKRPFYVPDIPGFSWVPRTFVYRPYDLNEMVALVLRGSTDQELSDAWQCAMQFRSDIVIDVTARLIESYAGSSAAPTP